LAFDGTSLRSDSLSPGYVANKHWMWVFLGHWLCTEPLYRDAYISLLIGTAAVTPLCLTEWTQWKRSWVG